MKLKIGFLGIIIIVAAGAVLLSRETMVLQLGNTDTSQRLHVRVSPSEPFSITYLHSMYREPVTEEFEVHPDGIVLRGVRTRSSAVREYYRFEESREFYAVHVNLGAFVLRVGEGEGQVLRVGGRSIYLTGLGKRGDRIGLNVRSVSLGNYLLTTLTGIGY